MDRLAPAFAIEGLLALVLLLAVALNLARIARVLESAAEVEAEDPDAVHVP